jgi:hypothetical protein
MYTSYAPGPTANDRLIRSWPLAFPGTDARRLVLVVALLSRRRRGRRSGRSLRHDAPVNGERLAGHRGWIDRHGERDVLFTALRLEQILPHPGQRQIVLTGLPGGQRFDRLRDRRQLGFLCVGQLRRLIGLGFLILVLREQRSRKNHRHCADRRCASPS